MVDIRSQGALTKWFMKSPGYLFRAHLGFVFGKRFLMIEHTGRKSGNTYFTPLEVAGRYPDAQEWIVTAGAGPASDWYRNLRANGADAVWIGSTRHPNPDVRFLGAPEASEVMKIYESKHPKTAAKLFSAMGVSYDGTDESRIEMMSEIPMVSLGVG